MDRAISFEEWLDALFDNPISDDRSWGQQREFEDELSYTQTILFATRLFTDPLVLVGRYRREQIKQGFDFLWSEDSFLCFARESSIDWEHRRLFIRSVYFLYDKLFRVDPLDDICHRFWLMMLMWPSPSRSSWKEDARPYLEYLLVMGDILEIPSDDCAIGALIGLDEISVFGVMYGMPWDPSRVISIIEPYLRKRAGVKSEAVQCAEQILRRALLQYK